MWQQPKPTNRYPKHPLVYLEHGANPPCSEVGPDPFFPEPGGDSNKVAAQARAICNSGDCTIKNECFNYAINVNVDGIWAGTNQRERAGYRSTHGIVPHDMSMEEFLPPVHTADGELINEFILRLRGIEKRHYG